MTLARLVPLAILGLSFVVTAYSQDKPAEAAEEKQRQLTSLIEAVLADIPNLHLAENRAYVFAKAGNLLWPGDNKRARTLLQTAASELIGAQQHADGKLKDSYRSEILSGQSTRPQILQTIAVSDAALALDAMYKSRSPIVSEAMAERPRKESKVSQYADGQKYHLAQNESQLEQTLLRLAADQNPEKAVELLKESLKKGVSHNSLDLLNRLREKSPEVAREMMTHIINRLTANQFLIGSQADHQGLGVAHSLLNSFIAARGVAETANHYDPAEMQAFAEKTIAAFSDTRVQQHTYYLGQAVEIAGKLLPNAVPRLKEALREQNRRQQVDEHQEEINKLVGSDASAQTLIGEARKFPLNVRGRIYESAAMKLAQAGDEAGAKELIEEHFAEDSRENVLNNLNSTRLHGLQNAGKFADAERAIDDFPASHHVSLLINLASSALHKGPVENRTYALALLAKARAAIADEPETSNELGQVMQLVSAYIPVETSEAFRLFESLTPQINSVAEASIIVNAFQGSWNVRQGETTIVNGHAFGFYLDGSILSNLAAKDFDRTLNIINGYSRREMRIALRLQIAENGSFRNPMVTRLPMSRARMSLN